MLKQLIFILVILLFLGIFTYTALRVISFIKLTKKGFPIKQIGKRIAITLGIAFGQTKILRRPAIGILHALVFWGFLVILFGSVEMIIDGITGSERVFSPAGIIYNILIAFGDVFAAIIIIACIAFLIRRLVMKVKRFSGVEMKPKSTIDASIALFLILLLMFSLIGMNMGYIASHDGNYSGVYPVSGMFVPLLGNLPAASWHVFHEVNWWIHIVFILIFLNILPYSKHFHIIMSLPNVFLSRLEPVTKLNNMESVTKEVKLMLNPETAYEAPAEDAPPPDRFGIKDVEDVYWKNYIDSLTCTECGRCTSVCPANITGKLLSPRKLFIDLRKRMNEKGPGLVKDKNYNDNKSLVGAYITPEELWACVTCNACVQECPVNINHVSFIIDMRRSLVMEDSAAPALLNQMFNNIENNGAPWQYSPEDRMVWAEGI
ncbi:MAG: (Fe-S)-binding protein [Bacteroidota bacterium]